MIGYIYQIVNKCNGKAYVGQTIDLERRKMNHFSDLKKGKHFNPYLQKAYNKYGVDNFDFIVIEECNETLLDEREEYWIQKLCTRKPNGYNILPGGSSLRGENNPFYGKKTLGRVEEKNV